ncbi:MULTISPECIES: DUF6660 family protein [Flavobacteriaceae]|uniref:DUF6660 family protein n=1 Tax=Winogradskyella poriferorum TaxID=307627 RepID=A0ABU7W7V9_9FLAO
MKFITLILSIYFLTLNTVPCSDIDKSIDDSQVVSVVDYNGEHDEDCELCSPFCHCHCCHVHTISFSLPSFKPYQPEVPKESFNHLDSLESNFYHSLFQPPQV